MQATVEGYLLSRHWRDTAQGVELTFWAASDAGPIQLKVPGTQSVAFIERGEPLELSPQQRQSIERRPLALSLLGGGPVDGLYCRHQRDLQALRQLGVPLAESDVKPHDRYLMERFVCAGFTATGNVIDHGTHRSIEHPRLKPAAVSPSLTALSVDIETRANSNGLYSIAGAVAGQDESAVVFMLGDATDPEPTTPPSETEDHDPIDIRFCADERGVLQGFFTWLRAVDPDLIVGWAVVNFDLDFLDRKCRALGVPFAIGRGGENAVVLQPSSQGQPRVARVPGRAVLDGIDLLKAGFWTFESFSLENVSRELLGTGKLITPEADKVGEINRLFREDKHQLAAYNLRDCTLVNDVFSKANLIAFAIQRANLTGLAIDRLGGSVAAFDNLYLPRLHRHGFVAPDLGHGDPGPGSPGGYVMDSQPGLYENVLVLDFKSLYPSIIRTFFIDPLGLAQPGEDPVAGYLDAEFSRTHSILPELITELWQARDDAKEENNAALSQAIKIIMNSFYGVLGSSGCRFHSAQLASSITRRGHDIITRSRDFIETHGYSVIYGDTDSLFALLGPGHSEEQANDIGRQLMTELNQWWVATLLTEHRLESHLEVEFETHYTRFLMPTVRGMPTGSKKRYAGIVTGRDGSPELIVKGLEAARTDWTPLARDFQRELFRRVFLDEPFDEFVLETAEALKRGELDEQLVYRKRLRRRLNDYQKNVPPHVQAARKLPKPGNWVKYVITRNGPEPVEALQSALDYEHYLERQLAPAADGVLQFLDTSFAAITDAQLQMF